MALIDSFINSVFINVQVTVKQETNTSDDKHLNESGKSGESGNENCHHSLVNSKTVKRKRNLSSPVKLPETKRRIIQNSSSDEGESSDASDSEQDSSDSDKEDSDRSVISSNSDEDSKTPAKAAQKSKAISPATSDRKKIEKENQPSSTKKRSREKEGSRIRKLQRYLKEAGISVVEVSFVGLNQIAMVQESELRTTQFSGKVVKAPEPNVENYWISLKSMD